MLTTTGAAQVPRAASWAQPLSVAGGSPLSSLTRVARAIGSGQDLGQCCPDCSVTASSLSLGFCCHYHDTALHVFSLHVFPSMFSPIGQNGADKTEKDWRNRFPGLRIPRHLVSTCPFSATKPPGMLLCPLRSQLLWVGKWYVSNTGKKTKFKTCW